jgi:hypothetical protein
VEVVDASVADANFVLAFAFFVKHLVHLIESFATKNYAGRFRIVRSDRLRLASAASSETSASTQRAKIRGIDSFHSRFASGTDRCAEQPRVAHSRSQRNSNTPDDFFSSQIAKQDTGPNSLASTNRRVRPENCTLLSTTA